MAAGRSRLYAAAASIALIAVVIAFGRASSTGWRRGDYRPAATRRGATCRSEPASISTCSRCPGRRAIARRKARTPTGSNARRPALCLRGARAVAAVRARLSRQIARTGRGEVDDETLRTLYDIMPSAGLIRHQWRKHGSLLGPVAGRLFRRAAAAREKVAIPAAIPPARRLPHARPDDAERRSSSNPGLTGEGIAVTCDRRFLREVRICMTKDLAFRACPEIDRRACRLDKVVMPPCAAARATNPASREPRGRHVAEPIDCQKIFAVGRPSAVAPAYSACGPAWSGWKRAPWMSRKQRSRPLLR